MIADGSSEADSPLSASFVAGLLFGSDLGGGTGESEGDFAATGEFADGTGAVAEGILVVAMGGGVGGTYSASESVDAVEKLEACDGRSELLAVGANDRIVLDSSPPLGCELAGGGAPPALLESPARESAARESAAPDATTGGGAAGTASTV